MFTSDHSDQYYLVFSMTGIIHWWCDDDIPNVNIDEIMISIS